MADTALAAEVTDTPAPAGASPATPPSVTPANGANGAGAQPAEAAAPDWRAQLPEALRNDGTLGRYKSLDELAKAHVEQHKVISTSVLKPPGPDAKPEEVQRFREAIGVPKMPSDYQLPEALDKTMENGFRTAAHKLGVPATVAKDLAEWYMGAEQQRLVEQDKVWTGELEKLKGEWGEGKYNQMERAAVRCVEAMAQEAGYQVPDVKKWLNDTRLGNHPMMFKMFAVMGSKMLEERLITGDQSAVNDAKSQIDTIRGDTSHPLNPANHRGDPARRAAWDDLYRQAWGTVEPQSR